MPRPIVVLGPRLDRRTSREAQSRISKGSYVPFLNGDQNKSPLGGGSFQVFGYRFYPYNLDRPLLCAVDPPQIRTEMRQVSPGPVETGPQDLKRALRAFFKSFRAQNSGQSQFFKPKLFFWKKNLSPKIPRQAKKRKWPAPWASFRTVKPTTNSPAQKDWGSSPRASDLSSQKSNSLFDLPGQKSV